MDEIKEKLDKIIELLEGQMCPQIKNQLMDWSQLFAGNCNCGEHKHGESTGGWFCPVHGDCF